MTTIYLIRHAEAEGNLYRIAQGQDDSILTDRGWRQVEALSRRFAQIPVDAVYASDLYRTCATASAICGPKGLPLHRRRDLREICVGVWERQTWGHIAREDPEQMENFGRHLERWQVEGAERPQAVLERMMAAVRQIAAENEGRTVAVVSHGCAIRILLAALQGLTIETLAQTPVGGNTAVSLLEAEGETMRVVFRDDDSHLRAPGHAAGERPRKRANGLEPGAWFQPLRLPEQADFLTTCVRETWDSAGEDRPWDPETLRTEAAERPALVGYVGEEPVGVVQLRPEKEAAQGNGWLTLSCVRPPYQGRGYGIQLLGQAVMYYRPLGRDRLRVALPDGAASRPFFTAHGFSPAGRTASGREILEKDISYHWEFLGE